MDTVRWIISTAPEIFPAAGGCHRHDPRPRQDSRLFDRHDGVHADRCRAHRAARYLYVSAVLRVVLFSLFVFTIGYRSGPEFFASLSIRTLAQVVMALVLGGTGLILVLVFAFTFKLDPGTASGLAAGALTQSSVIGTASGALAQLGLPKNVLKQQEANIAAGYAVTYVLGYILTLLYVPFVAPKLMGIDLKEEAAKLEAELSGGNPPKAENLSYRKFQARAYRVSAGRRPNRQGDRRRDRQPHRRSSELSARGRHPAASGHHSRSRRRHRHRRSEPPPSSPPSPSSAARSMPTRS